MTRSSTGGGFKPGYDPRRNVKGRKLNSLQIPDILRAIGKDKIPDELREKLPEHIRSSKTMLAALMRVTFTRAIQGDSWAVQFIAERTEGKVKDTLALEGGASLTVVEELTDGGTPCPP